MRSPEADDFAELARVLHEAPDIDDTLERTVALAVDALDCDFAGVSYSDSKRHRVETGAASAEVVRAGDQAQYELGEGPCLQAMTDGGTYRIDDVTTDPRWPRWGERARDLGLRSVLGIRLSHVGEVIGALNLYSSEPAHFDDEDLQVAEIFAVHASAALGHARQDLHLRRAIDARHLVGMAQGILMERFGLDQRGAFAVLRRYSQQHNVKLRMVAEQLVITRTLPDGSVSGSMPPPVDAAEAAVDSPVG